MLATARKVLRRAGRLMRQDGAHDCPPQPQDVRTRIAAEYLRGSGLEIGALHNPLRLPGWATVRYVDRMSVADLRRQYPELADCPLVKVDIIDDGERLATIGDESQDFVVANHFLEHCQDVIGTVKHFFRVLRPGGVLYAALPDKRFTFDAKRAVTNLEHLWEDHLRGPEHARLAHYEDYVAGVHGDLPPEEQRLRLRDFLAKDYSIHFHVWTQTEMLEMVVMLQRLIGFEIEVVRKHGVEVIFVLRKGGG